MLKRAYSQVKGFLHSYPVWDNIYISGTESKPSAYLQIPSILSRSFNSVLAAGVWLGVLSVEYF